MANRYVEATAFAESTPYTRTESASAGTLKAKLGEFVSVKDQPYGAAGDDATDDTAAIQAALDANLTVLFPEGTYKIAGRLFLRSGHRLYSTAGAVIRQTASQTAILQGDGLTAGLTVDGLTLRGLGTDYDNASHNAASATARGVHVVGTAASANVVVRNCRFENIAYAPISLKNVAGYRIEANTVVGTGEYEENIPEDGNYQFGIFVEADCSGGYITRNDISRTAQGIYYGSRSGDAYIDFNKIYDIDGQHGVYAADATELTFAYNQIFRTHLQGMKIQKDNTVNEPGGEPARRVLINHNTFLDCGSHCVLLTNIDTIAPAANQLYDVEIFGNSFNWSVLGSPGVAGEGGAGVYLLYTHRAKVAHNVQSGGQYGLFSRYSEDVAYEFNQVNNVYHSAVYLGPPDVAGTTTARRIAIRQNIIHNYGLAETAGNQYGLFLNETDDVTVEGNEVTNDVTSALMYDLYANLNTTAAYASLRVRRNRFRGNNVRLQDTAKPIGQWDFNDYLAFATGYPTTAVVPGHRRGWYHSDAIPATGGPYNIGDFCEANNPGAVAVGTQGWVCIVAGSPGTWVPVGPTGITNRGGTLTGNLTIATGDGTTQLTAGAAAAAYTGTGVLGRSGAGNGLLGLVLNGIAANLQQTAAHVSNPVLNLLRSAAGTGPCILLNDTGGGGGKLASLQVSGAEKFGVTAAGALKSGGAGSPEGVVTAPVGSLYLRTDGGAGSTLYVKESGTGNTGWVAK